jgi:hypothetical protein
MVCDRSGYGARYEATNAVARQQRACLKYEYGYVCVAAFAPNDYSRSLRFKKAETSLFFYTHRTSSLAFDARRR